MHCRKTWFFVVLYFVRWAACNAFSNNTQGNETEIIVHQAEKSTADTFFNVTEVTITYEDSDITSNNNITTISTKQLLTKDTTNQPNETFSYLNEELNATTEDIPINIVTISDDAVFVSTTTKTDELTTTEEELNVTTSDDLFVTEKKSQDLRPPANLTCLNTTYNSILIKWDPPRYATGENLSYSLEWNDIENPENSSFSESNESTYLIKDLESFKNYSIKVAAETERGRSNYTEIIVETEPGIPSVPRNLTVEEVKNTSFNARWLAPSTLAGHSVDYLLEWFPTLNPENVTNQATNQTNELVAGLEPFTDYSVRVAARNTFGQSNWTEEVVVRTLEGVPRAPFNLSFGEVNQSSFEIEWAEPEARSNRSMQYIVAWKLLTDEEEKISLLLNETFYRVKDVDAFSNYSVRVAAETIIGRSNWSESVTIQTEIGVPTVPRGLTFDNITEESVVARWKEPLKLNAPSVNYTLKWYALGNPSLTFTVFLQETIHEIVELAPDRLYSAKVAAYTSAGQSEWTKVITVKTAVGIPGPPLNISANLITNTSFWLHWELPRRYREISIAYYVVVWSPFLNSSNQAKTEVKGRTIFINQLEPYTVYEIKVAAKTSEGTGDFSDPFHVRTDVGISSRPRQFRAENITSTGAVLTWLPPSDPKGSVNGFIVRSSTIVWVTEKLDFVVDQLKPWTEYNASVQAININRNEESVMGDEAFVEFQTKAAVPNRPFLAKPKIKGPRSIEVSWSTKGVVFPGPINYTLQVWKKSTECDVHLNDIQVLEDLGIHKWLTPNIRLVEDLRPYTSYFFRVILQTEAGKSISDYSDVVRTQPDIPGRPTDVRADCNQGPTFAEISWKPPIHPNGHITHYRLDYYSEKGKHTILITTTKECPEEVTEVLNELHPELSYGIGVSAKVDGISEFGEEAVFRGNCILPAGIPPLGNASAVKMGTQGQTEVAFEWSQEAFSPEMGMLRYYAVLVGKPKALGNATRGSEHEAFATWFNFTEGDSEVYQATPTDWNPFDESVSDPLQCKHLGNATLVCYIGKERNCSKEDVTKFCNGPLKPGTFYGMKIRAFTMAGFSETPPILVYTAALKKYSPRNALIATLIVVLLGTVVIVPAVILFQKHPDKVRKLRNGVTGWFQGDSSAPSQQRGAAPKTHLMAPPTKGLTIHNFEEHVKNMQSDSFLKFSLEFEELKKNSPKHEYNAAEMEENRLKNRWMNIFPFDHSRVKLLPMADEPGSDFINANYIPGYNGHREYIASQGPLAETVDDFWRMIWEQSVSIIVMLTQCVERGKNKCEQYWPSDTDGIHYGDLKVQMISESILSAYAIRIFRVQLGSRERKVKQMHFTRWPDFGCPERSQDLVNFVRAVREHLPRTNPGPMLVHCSAGVGRTGTFIAVDRLMQHLRFHEDVNVYDTVLDMRRYRTNMVQTEDQYIYIHHCIVELILERKNENDTPDCDNEEIYSNIVGSVKDTGV